MTYMAYGLPFQPPAGRSVVRPMLPPRDGSYAARAPSDPGGRGLVEGLRHQSRQLLVRIGGGGAQIQKQQVGFDAPDDGGLQHAEPVGDVVRDALSPMDGHSHTGHRLPRQIPAPYRGPHLLNVEAHAPPRPAV